MKTSSEVENFSFTSRLRSFSDAWNGLIYAIYNIHNLWIQIVISILVVWAGFLFDISNIEWCMIIFSVGLVIAAEIFNFSVESIADYLLPNDEEFSSKIKNISAAAVFVTVLAASVIGLIIFVPLIIN